MPFLKSLSLQLLREYLPALTAGGVAGLAFVTLGQTPLVRALGLAGAIVGISLTLQRFSGSLAIIGGLALAFSPAFWSQTGGGDEPTLAITAVALVVASAAIVLFAGLGKRPALGMSIGLIVFALLFWALVGTPRSLRITIFLSAWTLYFLIDALFLTNPRPEGPAPITLPTYHQLSLLLMLIIGVLNDPLFILIGPAVVAGLILAKTRLPNWYWLGIVVIFSIGIRGIIVQYLDSGWWLYPAQQAESLNIQVPYVMADGWREATRWIKLFNLVIGQFTLVGLFLGVLGLSRLARWYPALGEVTMITYAAYALFGLVYFGKDSQVLLLPLLMIQVIWMTYAVYTLGQWLQKSFLSTKRLTRWLAPAIFTLLPLTLFLRIAGVL